MKADAMRNKQFAAAVADKLIAGVELDQMEREFTAALLRKWAAAAPIIRRRPGRPPTFDAGDAKTRAAVLMGLHGRNQEDAFAEVALDLGVAEESIKKAIANEGGLKSLVETLRAMKGKNSR